MAFLGIDIGSGSVGVAISLGGELASPHSIIPARLWRAGIQKLIQEKSITDCVVGMPRISVGENENAQRVRDAIRFLESCGVTVHVVDETNTTGFALSLGSTVHEPSRKVVSKRVDDTAAAMILQRYLDTRRGPRSIFQD